MRFAKRYIWVFLGSLLAVLLFELICHPFGPAQLTKDADVKTAGSLLVLTDETPQQLRIYHRAFFLPRYRLDCALEVTGADLMTANKDLFQVCAVSVENGQIVLYAQKNIVTPFLLLGTFLIFTVLLCQTLEPFAHRRASRGG